MKNLIYYMTCLLAILVALFFVYAMGYIFLKAVEEIVLVNIF